MKENIIILSAKNWSMADEQTGNIRSGISIHYLLTDNLKPWSDPDGSRGFTPCKQTIPLTMEHSLASVPGLYEADLSMKISGGKNVLSITGLSFISEVGD